MVVLSAGVITKTGKVLVARQFVPMTRIRIESLLAAFPKLITGDAQHTFVETEQVRYLYHPLDQLYILLVTNKQSNIMEDLDTLRLLSKVVPEYANGHSEEAVSTNSFELVFAFDEVCNIGLKENVTLEQIRTFTEMDSHEEKLQKIILESKMNEAREEARRKAETIDKQKAEIRKMQSSVKGLGSGGGPQMMGGGRYGGGGDSSRYGSGGGGGGGGDGYEEREERKRERPPAKKAPTNRPKGMTLGGSKKKDDLVSQMFKEDGLAGPRAPMQMQMNRGGGGVADAVPVNQDKVFVTVLEKLYCALEREGGVKKLDVQGEVKVTIFDPDNSRICIQTSGNLGSDYKCRFNPKMDQKKFQSDGILQLKDPAKPFPVGSENAPVILKWRMQTTEEDQVPFTVNFWPNVEDGQTVVSVEFALEKSDLAYSNVAISIPCDSGEPPQVTSVDGDFHYDQREKVLIWSVEEISENCSSGTLEFSVPEMDPDDFYPLHVAFTSEQTYSGMQIEGVANVENGEAIDFESKVSLQAEKFTID
mmetsp:Transcript_21812/g.30821  ORF Transcript_21812/g.30821 Transcript_21812/m.30821 type:complete len:533 (-) Transcript_21812:18-1616(-)